MNRRTLLGTALVLPALPAFAQQSGWPERPITLVEGYPPGGVTDLATRAVADPMTRNLGVPVVVENRPGAATSVAATYAARARPDGYTLVMGTTTLAINQTLQPQLTPKDPAKELDAIGMVFRTPFILHVHPSLPVKNTAELIAYCKANPGKVLFGSPGTGSVSHLCLEMFRARAGIDIVHVPYRGGAPAALDLRQGRIHVVFHAIQEAATTLADGGTRGLAVTANAPLPGYPNLPPVSETLPGFEVFFWQGLFAPAGTPAPILARAATALRAATDDPTLRTRMSEQGVELVTGDAEMLRATLASDTRRWGDVIREGNIKLE
ncbi:Bug family tripartite tricarboxylate transporter substrate binding protein [Roseomonas xinghualingensis]|uniref:Bug family tripartite tricarboxylate transporter substrate binding protein n=1 Tax=Roseomonas xinghualingensis TaxID=2986475 RepID=UPI0021F20DA4|nr:tripartite tricarboxylate transporter substrate-binding protein [Roseomonas sp. SXEYE001]MCV4206135.1 tripartite tricarboxylate transporter substrate-binding protein [Roseomonas sp. SXEYE001]